MTEEWHNRGNDFYLPLIKYVEFGSVVVTESVAFYSGYNAPTHYEISKQGLEHAGSLS
jgi:hypothetical protein